MSKRKRPPLVHAPPRPHWIIPSLCSGAGDVGAMASDVTCPDCVALLANERALAAWSAQVERFYSRGDCQEKSVARETSPK